jgi:chromosome segregation ATPase
MLTRLAQSQVLINSKDLPVLTKKDTIAFNCEAWVENPQDEMRQRAKILKLEKRINKVISILKKKQGYEMQIDSLILEAEKIRYEKDSLLDVIDNQKKQVTEDINNHINDLNSEIAYLKNDYFRLRASRDLWRRSSLISFGCNIILVILLL